MWKGFTADYVNWPSQLQVTWGRVSLGIERLQLNEMRLSLRCSRRAIFATRMSDGGFVREGFCWEERPRRLSGERER